MRIGVDLGGTKIEGVVLDNEGRERRRERIATPQGDYDATVRAIADLVSRLDPDAAATVGVGTPGTISRLTGRMKNANSTWLNGRALDADIATAIGRPVRIANDANCFALSEAVDGAGRGADVVFGVILGTGVGGGVVVHGRPVGGANGIGGEWGHNPLPETDAAERASRSCYCGRSGCTETFLSGPAIEAECVRLGGPDMRATEIAASPDPIARDVIDRYVLRLAAALGTVINLLDPDVIVLGGGLSRIDLLYERVPEAWTSFVFSDRVDTRLARNAHGDAGGVRGAAWLWPRV